MSGRYELAQSIANNHVSRLGNLMKTSLLVGRPSRHRALKKPGSHFRDDGQREQSAVNLN